MLQLGLCGKWAFMPAPSRHPERQPAAPDYTELEFTVYRLLRPLLTIRVHACQPPPSSHTGSLSGLLALRSRRR